MKMQNPKKFMYEGFRPPIASKLQTSKHTIDPEVVNPVIIDSNLKITK